MGEVVASRSDLEIGDRVVGWVRDADGLAEYVTTDAAMLAVLDSRVDDAVAVALQPLACVLYAVDRMREVRGRSVAIVGLGAIGLLFAHVLSRRGADRIIGVDPVDRGDVAARFGVTTLRRTHAGPWARDALDRPEVVVEAVGHQVGTLADAIRAVATGGEIFYFGVPDDEWYPIPFLLFKNKNLSLHVGNTPVDFRREYLQRAATYVVEHPDLLDPYVTHVLRAEEAQAAYDLACRPQVGRLKVVLEASA